MTEAFPLPIEVLHLVITNLVIKRELKTLAALLRVNKHVCLATLPILYADPFVWFTHRDLGHQGYRTISSYNSVYLVIRLLFVSVPKDSYSGLINAMYGIEDMLKNSLGDPSVANVDIPSARTSQHWPIDYLSYVRHANTQNQHGESLLADFASNIELEPRLKSYVEEHRLAEAYAAMEVHASEWLARGLMTKTDPLILEYLALDIHREATWALCSPILEQLQSIVIPLSDIGRYSDALPRLSSLVNITFKLDVCCDVSKQVLESMDRESVKIIVQRRKKREQDLEAAVEFVRTHTAVFPGSLGQVHFPRSLVQSRSQVCPRAILDRILDLLPTLIDPLELVQKNWKQFVAKVDQTNLAYVKAIDVWEDCAKESYDQLKLKPFLHRCTSLRKYNMISLGPDSFKWAVQSNPSNNGLDQDHHGTLVARTAANVPPLEDVNIQAQKVPFGSELDDIGLGFGATLRSLIIHGHSRETQQAGTQSLSVGQGWRMPVLSTLLVNFPSETLVLDPDFFRYCPLLEYLSLADSLETYDLSEIQVGHPANLPELAKLFLVGSGALSFHPDTLHSTKELQRLKLGSCASSRFTFIPSIQEIDQDDHQQNHANTGDSSTTAPLINRPRWTWDWYLPSLRILHLNVEFAFHFQFRMLQGTPNLHDLYLSIYSIVHPLERVLTRGDFNLPQGQSRTQEADADNRNDDNPASPKDMNDSTDLHSQPFTVLNSIHTYLTSVNRRRTAIFEMTEPQRSPGGWLEPEEEQTEERLLLNREGIMGMNLRGWRPWHVCLDHPDGNCPEKNTPERIALMVQTIEELVDQACLQVELDAALAALRVSSTRERQEEEGLRRYRVEHPNHLVVPSVKKLEIFGRWIMSDDVLEILLGRVFRNLKEMNECMTEGYSLDTLVKVTQSMPWLETAQSVNPVDLDSLKDEHKLQLHVNDIRLPFSDDARTRVYYRFVGHQSYILAANGGSEAQ
ncbi:hypothetical protein BGZ82_002805 [Podila clonocystis]|nr:hypothetical protein BGZ82_002805 [Podila clonocystis]